jgi:UDP-2,3-diacylglucosamine hydrolase
MELQALPGWRSIDFISDLHLQASEAKTFQAWQHYLSHTTADAVFMLGDVFEVWIGDDVLSDPQSFESACVQTLKAASQRLAIFLMHGNRDFLMGSGLVHAAGVSLIEDSTTLIFSGHRWVLTHGDALCLDDTDYLAFRTTVRSEAWQTQFLSKPLQERQALARQMRNTSEARKQSDYVYADVDTEAADSCLVDAKADGMIHGHTHRPNRHALGPHRARWVLSDWHFDGTTTRGDVLRLDVKQTEPYRLDALTLQPKTQR